MLDDPKKQNIIKKSSQELSNNLKQNTEKAIYTRKLQELLKDKEKANEFISQAYHQYLQYGTQYKPYLDGEDFKKFIDLCISVKGNYVDLNWIDTANVTDMNCLFKDSMFNGDISNWNVSHVTNMKSMFSHSEFDRSILNWQVYNVIDMSNMFRNTIIYRF